MSDFPLQWLVLDLNGFFAACEQQENPALRGKPVIVAPMLSDTTCAIAASYPAKAYGIKTGTPVWEAKQLCPDLIVVGARPKLYVEYHHRIIEAVDQCIPVEDVMSIDEMACRLDKTQRTPEAATRLAAEIKRSIHTRVGEALTSSIGFASNRLLAKLASDMQKPDGLTILEPGSLPHKILHLDIQAVSGIGRNMAERLRAAGLDTMEKLWYADSNSFRRAWGGVVGARFHAMLHGEDLPAPVHPRRSMSHQHVLAPIERNVTASTIVIRQLLARVANRLRHEEFYCSRMIVDIKWLQNNGYWVAEQKFSETQDTVVLTRILSSIWSKAPLQKPLRIGVTLAGLVPITCHQGDLFERKPDAALIAAMDRLNEKFGLGTINLGPTPVSLRRMTSKIAFHRVPELREFI